MILTEKFGCVLLIVFLAAAVATSVRRRLSAAQTAAAIALAAYLALLLSVTLLPMSLTRGLAFGVEREAYPLPGSYFAAMWDLSKLGGSEAGYLPLLFRHALAYLPPGFLLPLVDARLAHLRAILPAVAAASLLIEIAQLFEGLSVGILYKVASFDEVLLAALGGSAGFLLFSLVYLAYTKRRVFMEA